VNSSSSVHTSVVRNTLPLGSLTKWIRSWGRKEKEERERVVGVLLSERQGFFIKIGDGSRWWEIRFVDILNCVDFLITDPTGGEESPTVQDLCEMNMMTKLAGKMFPDSRDPNEAQLVNMKRINEDLQSSRVYYLLSQLYEIVGE